MNLCQNGKTKRVIPWKQAYTNKLQIFIGSFAVSFPSMGEGGLRKTCWWGLKPGLKIPCIFPQGLKFSFGSIRTQLAMVNIRCIPGYAPTLVCICYQISRCNRTTSLQELVQKICYHSSVRLPLPLNTFLQFVL